MRNPKSHADDLHLAFKTLGHMLLNFLRKFVLVIQYQRVDVEGDLFFGKMSFHAHTYPIHLDFGCWLNLSLSGSV